MEELSVNIEAIGKSGHLAKWFLGIFAQDPFQI